MINRITTSIKYIVLCFVCPLIAFSSAIGQDLNPPPSFDPEDLVPLPFVFNLDDQDIDWLNDPLFFEFEGAALARIENPDRSGINETDSVMFYLKTDGGQPWAGFFYHLPEPMEFGDNPTFSMKVWSPRAGIEMMLKLEMQAGPESPEMFVEIPEAEEWVELEWDLTEAGEAPWDVVVIIAQNDGTSPGGGDAWTWYLDDFKFSDVGHDTETSSELVGSEIPESLQLSQNYPNPFNPSTKIDFALPEASQVSLTVYNMLGQQVATLEDGFLSAGQHSVSFDASNLSSGIYLYRLQAGDQVMTRTLTLVK